MRTRSVFSHPDGDFAAVLASLDEGEASDFFRPVAGIGRLWTPAPGENFDAAGIASAYAEQQPAIPVEARQIPDFAEIAAKISAARGADALHRLRRAVAFATHPDRVPVEGRAEAERLMARVNAAIDAAIDAALAR